jgi:Zn-finger nucleic acid-binding protein
LDKIIEREATAPSRERAYRKDYDDDDRRYRGRRKRDGFFDDVFDIFD